ncbi:MAG: dimethylargininase [Acidobacteriia bacterium]|nr:dimethylargininase [Terriglobia bacterium]
MPIAITRKVSPALAHCELTHLARTPIDVELAAAQHEEYERTLARLGCWVVSLPAEADLPDSVFIEDTAVVVEEVAVITRPGARSRRPETAPVAAVLAKYRPVVSIEAPGTLDGGDVLRLGRRVLVGLSERSNREGIDQLSRLLSHHGYKVEAVPLGGCLHLKSAATQVTPDTVLVNPAWVDPATFSGFTRIDVYAGEPYAANALMVGDRVVYPDAFPHTAARLDRAAVPIVAVDVSELAKAEGAVTCCSLILTG